MNYTQRMIVIVNALFDREIPPEAMRSYMTAFIANATIPPGATQEQMSESVCEAQIARWQGEIIAAISAYNEKMVSQQVAEFEAGVRNTAAQQLQSIIGS